MTLGKNVSCELLTLGILKNRLQNIEILSQDLNLTMKKVSLFMSC